MTPAVAASICALSGLLALLLSGGPGASMAGLGLLGLAAGWGLARPPAEESLAWKIATATAALATGILPMLRVLSWLDAGVMLTVYLLVHRAWNRRAPQDDRIAMVLGLLAILVAATISRSPLMAFVVAAWALSAPAALTGLQVAEEAGPSARAPTRWLAGVAPAGLILAGLIFLLLPRFQSGLLAAEGEVQSVAGFSEGVSLGDIGAIQENRALVMRVEAERLTEDPDAPARVSAPFYLRGTVLDTFDGQRWYATPAGANGRPQIRQAERRPDGLRPGDIEQRILLEPMSERHVFGLRRVLGVQRPNAGLQERPLGVWKFEGPPERSSYTVWSRPLDGRDGVDAPSPRRRRHLIRLPDDLDPRIPALAREITAGAQTDPERAEALSRWLRQNLRYTDVPEVGKADQPLAGFLFETRAGHCEYFATALAVMLRALEIPAVMATGFYGGEWNPMGGYYVIRQSDAHAWVEAWTGEGWAQLDATPATGASGERDVLTQVVEVWMGWWGGQVLDYDLDAQIEIAAGAARLLSGGGLEPTLGGDPGSLATTRALILPLALAGGAFLVFLRVLTFTGLPLLARRRRPGLEREWRRAVALARRRGYEAPPALPPLEAARWIRAEAGEAAAPMEALAWLLYRARYGGEAEAGLRPAARDEVRALRGLPRRAG